MAAREGVEKVVVEVWPGLVATMTQLWRPETGRRVRAKALSAEEYSSLHSSVVMRMWDGKA